jgi:hypothetical protein
LTDEQKHRLPFLLHGIRAHWLRAHWFMPMGPRGDHPVEHEHEDEDEGPGEPE